MTTKQTKDLDVNLSLWVEDFTQLVIKMIEFQQSAFSSENFYFDRSTWLRGFNLAVKPEAPLEPSSMFLLVFYALEYLASRDLANGVRDSKPEEMLDALQGILDLVLAKNRDYGSSALSSPVLLPWLDIRCGLLVRLSDKIHRLRNLYFAEGSEVAEPLEDTLRDIVGYIFLIYSVIRTQDIQSREEPAGESREV